MNIKEHNMSPQESTLRGRARHLVDHSKANVLLDEIKVTIVFSSLVDKLDYSAPLSHIKEGYCGLNEEWFYQNTDVIRNITDLK